MMARSLVLGATLLSAPRLGWCASKKAAGTPAVTIALTSTPIRRALPGSIAGGISRPPLRQSQPCSQRQARTCASGAPMAAGAAKDGDVIFRQLFDAQFGSSTFTYILGCPDSREAVIVDPVLELVRGPPLHHRPSHTTTSGTVGRRSPSQSLYSRRGRDFLLEGFCCQAYAPLPFFRSLDGASGSPPSASVSTLAL